MLRGDRSKFNIFPSLKVVFILVNSADPDEMPPHVAFHLGLHCLPKYLFIYMQNKNGLFLHQTLVVILTGRISERSQRYASNEQYSIGFGGEIRKTAS